MVINADNGMVVRAGETDQSMGLVQIIFTQILIVYYQVDSINTGQLYQMSKKTGNSTDRNFIEITDNID